MHTIMVEEDIQIANQPMRIDNLTETAAQLPLAEDRPILYSDGVTTSYNPQPTVWPVRYSALFGCLAALLLLTGCADFTMTNPPRTVTEQLLLSTAADQAIKSASLDMFQGKKVFIDGTYFDAYDSKYVLGAIRDAFSQAGALLAVDAGSSDMIVEARSGAYSIDYNSSLIGIPTLGVPIPLAGTVSIPELAFYKSSQQHTIAKFALLAYDTKSRAHFYSSGPMVGKSYNNFHKILGFLWTGTDIPEKKKPKK